MKPIISCLTILFIFGTLSLFAQVGINNTSPDSSSVLDIQSNEKGVLIPRMTSSERTMISNPADGLLVFDSSTKSFWFRKAGKWTELIDKATEKWKENGSDIFYNTGRVGIGTNSPDRQLHSHFSNSNINTSGFLIDQDGPGDAFMNFGLTGSHHYSLGVDQSDGAKFKIGYFPTGPFGVHTGTKFAMRTNGQVGIGTASPSDRMQIDADSAEAALRVRIAGATKLRIRENGGVSIGQNATTPTNGLRVKGVVQPDGNISTPNNLLIESTGANTLVQMQKGSNNLLVDDIGVFGASQDLMIFETGTENNKIEMTSEGMTVRSDNNVMILSSGSNKAVTIKAGNTLITVSQSGGITIDTDGNELNVNTHGGAMNFNSDGGKISLLAGAGDIEMSGDDLDITAARTLDMISDNAMYIESFDRLDLKSRFEMKFNAGLKLIGMSMSDIQLDAGLNIDFDGNTFDFDGSMFDWDATGSAFLNSSLIQLNGPGQSAARVGDLCGGGIVPNPIITGSATVLIGN
jgi:hypothetical protein